VDSVLSGADYALLVTPVSLALFGWIALVFWADFHPNVRHVDNVHDRAVSRSDGGQVMPGAGDGTDEATLATGAADENAVPETAARQAAEPETAMHEPADPGPGRDRGDEA
jgi:hypothetical protein